MHNYLCPPDYLPCYGDLYISKAARIRWIMYGFSYNKTAVSLIREDRSSPAAVTLKNLRTILHHGDYFAQLLISKNS